MGDPTPTSELYPHGNDSARMFLSIVVVAFLAIAPILCSTRQRHLAVWGVYVLPIALAASLPFAIRLVRQGSAPAPPLAVLLGITVFLGTAGFDIAATLLHSPDLRRESNPLARALLDSGHTVPFVLTYGFVCQGLYLACLCVLWVALLRHRPRLIDSVRGEASFFHFLKRASGGEKLTWRQWLLPLRWSELPIAYYALWVSAVILWSGSVDRLYLGLHWFGCVPHIRWRVAVIGILAGLVVYFGWLWRVSRKQPCRKQL